MKKRIFRISLLFLLCFLFFSFAEFLAETPKEKQETTQISSVSMNLLKLLDITPSAESIDYVQDKTQFQLHTLLTEQRHTKTWNLSERIQKDYEAGLNMLFSVDEDIVTKLEALAQNTEAMDQAAQAIEDAILSGNKIYFYGCGATGRLAKQMESTFWRPFWKKIKKSGRIWNKIRKHVREPIEDQLIGEMTGADRALISSLEGFEDLLLIGRLQLEDRKIKKGDVVICVTEGGETSSVIGTILAALDQWKLDQDYDPEITRKKLYFVYNNPDEKLRPFHRSRRVLDEPGITKINLTTGPQSITGSTRMQATTIETFVAANILQTALDSTLRKFLSSKDMTRIGFEGSFRLEEKLMDFTQILRKVKRNIPAISKFTELESKTYGNGRFSTYFAREGLITVFIDSTERSPTFRLFPLDTVKEPDRKCWIQVWTSAVNLQDAWQTFLGRSFRGLSPQFYRTPFTEEISDPYLKRAALESLRNAGDDQQFLYDFSFSEFNLKNRGPEYGDLGVLVLISPEEAQLRDKRSDFLEFLQLFSKKKGRNAILIVTPESEKEITRLIQDIPGFDPKGKDALVVVNAPFENDPLGINSQIALKIILNAHSTAVMARLGKVIGNTMTNVSPSNLKLIGRATYLIQSHVNDLLNRPQWVKLYGIRNQISYGEANAVLFEAIKFLKNKKTKAGQTAEVALSIIHILESLRLKKGLTQEEAFEIVNNKGLNQYLSDAISVSQN
jgi:N-acetylmuramic acid 6-phosphate (MurNAc-6-P) etherase